MALGQYYLQPPASYADAARWLTLAVEQGGQAVRPSALFYLGQVAQQQPQLLPVHRQDPAAYFRRAAGYGH
ncbi:hypothetical protein GCM10027048_43550 [Hymenobacter coalescens]